MPRDFSPPTLFTGAAKAEKVVEGVVLFFWKEAPAAAKGRTKLERSGELEARRKAVENSLKVWRRMMRRKLGPLGRGGEGGGLGNDLYGI